MHTITEMAHAKINLSLDVLFKRPDGYHEVEMIMQSLELADSLVMKRVDAGIKLIVESGDVPIGENNLVWQAAELMFDSFGCAGGIEISLNKRIPVAAGLAGGSSDAAAVIRGVNRLWELNLSDDVLRNIGAKLGSDIPFCISGITSLAKGRGEVLTVLQSWREQWIVLVKPPVEVSTAKVYTAYRAEKVQSRPDTMGLLQALSSDNHEKVPRMLCNVLESVTLEVVPETAAIKQKLLHAGALSALMSGSGPTVYAVASGYEQALTLAEVFQDTGYLVEITKTRG